MKTLLLSLSALLLISCSSEQKTQESQKTPKEVSSKPVKKQEVAKVAPILHKSEGEILFQKCASCHGSKGEKSALNKSQIILGWDAIQITVALVGYKEGTYGGDMKGLMQTQVKNLSDEDIAKIAAYIQKQ